jgi:uncharacterized protein (DUF1501 family)
MKGPSRDEAARGPCSRPIARRELLKASALLGAFGLSRVSLGQTPGGKVLVTLFMRGGADGLSMIPPYGDPAYAALRPTLQLRAPGSGGEDAALKLDGTFGLHPAMAALLPLYQSGQLCVVHAVGQHAPTRSHFDAQDFLEAGLEGQKASDGWLNRALVDLPGSASTFRAVAVQNGVPMAMQGAQSVVAFPALKDFRVGPASAGSFEALYSQAVDEALRTRGAEAFEGLQTLADRHLADQAARNGAEYPNSPLGKRLHDIARLISGGVGLQVAATEAGGFDTHLGEGAGKGQLATRLKDLADSVAAFVTDLGEQMKDVALVTMTEFGRTARENGTRGTDHGTASAMLVVGGGVKGGRVVSDWPGLAQGQLFEGRDLRVTLDIRTVLAELLASHLQVAKVERALPGAKPARVLYG